MTIHSSGSAWTTSTRQTAEELDEKFPRPREWTSTYPGHGEISPSRSESNRGQYAIDLMVSDRDLGNALAQYAWDNRKRLGIRYVIYYGRIISETSSTPNRWVRYFNADNPNPSKSHKNHVHVSRYSNKGYTAPEGSKPAEPAKPDPAGDYPTPKTKVIYLDKMKRGQRNSDSVYWVQRLLREVGYDEVLKTGTYDAATVAGALAFQKAMKNDPRYCDGILGRNDLAALIDRGKTSGIRVEAKS